MNSLHWMLTEECIEINTSFMGGTQATVAVPNRALVVFQSCLQYGQDGRTTSYSCINRSLALGCLSKRYDCVMRLSAGDIDPEGNDSYCYLLILL